MEAALQALRDGKTVFLVSITYAGADWM